MILTCEDFKFFADQIWGFKENFESWFKEEQLVREHIDNQIKALCLSYSQKHRKSRPFRPGANCCFNNYYEKRKLAGPEGFYIDRYQLFTKSFKPKTKGIEAVEIYEDRSIIVPDFPSKHELSEKFRDFSEIHPYWIRTEIIKNDFCDFKKFSLYVYVEPRSKINQDEEIIATTQSEIWKLRNQIPKDFYVYRLIRDGLGKFFNTRHQEAYEDRKVRRALDKLKVLEADFFDERKLTVEEAIRNKEILKELYKKYNSQIEKGEEMSKRINQLEREYGRQIKEKRTPFTITFQWWDNKSMLRAFPPGWGHREFEAIVRNPKRRHSLEDFKSMERALKLGKSKEDFEFWAGYLPEFWSGELKAPRSRVKTVKRDLGEFNPNLVVFQTWEELYLQIGIYAYQAGLLSESTKRLFIEDFRKFFAQKLKGKRLVEKVFKSKEVCLRILEKYEMPFALNHFWNYVSKIYNRFHDPSGLDIGEVDEVKKLNTKQELREQSESRIPTNEDSIFMVSQKIGAQEKTIYKWIERGRVKSAKKEEGKWKINPDAYNEILSLVKHLNMRLDWDESIPLIEAVEKYSREHKVSKQSAKGTLRRWVRDHKKGKLSKKLEKKLMAYCPSLKMGRKRH